MKYIWITLFALSLACSSGTSNDPKPASLRILSPPVGTLVVHIHSTQFDTTITAPACIRWQELYVSPVLDAEYLGKHYLGYSLSLWPEMLPNAIAGIDDTGFVLEAFTGLQRC